MSPTAPSGVKSHDGYCVQPADGSCKPGDGTKIKFGKKGLCTDSFMEFRLDANGVLRHHCSGKMVCPDNGNNGAALGVSSGCTEENSKFTRTEGEFVFNSVQNKAMYGTGSALFPIEHFGPMIGLSKPGKLSLARSEMFRAFALKYESIITLVEGGEEVGMEGGVVGGNGEGGEEEAGRR